ncbi:DUF7848 domain-containing protein [Streptomyces sp. NPDC002309]
MTPVSRVAPYPLLAPDEGIAALPEKLFVECAQCLETETVTSEDEARKWATKHLTDRRSLVGRPHDRFRLTSTRRWSLKPT